MQKYSREIVAEVLAANDIVDVVSVALELKPAGAGRFKALCPFHIEKTPSFTVSRDRQIFHCFGCGKGGDVLAFVQEHEGLSFVEALKKLADRGGVRLPALSERDDKAEFLRTRLIEFNTFASRHYRAVLADPMRGSRARQYLKTRQLKEATVRRFEVGYAPEGWSSLLDAARERGFKDSVLEASGLFKRGERGTLYDFFRNRVMFPIKNTSGNLVAFGGRDLGDSPAKYINSPETPVYKKSRVLYGLHEARDAMRRAKHAILVEGYFDLLRCFDAGIEDVVATCGTALTPEQAALIRRYVPEAVLVYDGDAAGVQAALRGTGVLIAAGLTVRALALPENQDPDDFIKAAGAEAFRERVDEAPDFVTFYVRMSQERAATIEGRTEVAQEIFGMLQGIDDEVRIDEYLKHTAREMGLNEWACRTEYDKFRRKALRRPVPKQEESIAPAIGRDDCDFVAALLNNEVLLARAKKSLTGLELPPGPVSEILEKLFADHAAQLHQELESEAAQRLYTAAASLERPTSDSPDVLVSKRINRLEQEALRAQAAGLQRAIQEAERTQDQVRVTRLFVEKVRLEQQIRELGTA